MASPHQNIDDIDFTPELSFSTSRSGGKGGQHANKTETRVILEFDVGESQLLTDQQKERIIRELGNRINKEGKLKIAVEEERSQYRNKKIAVELFYDLLKEALKPAKKRKKTKKPKSVDEKRLEEKKIRSIKKKARKDVDPGPYNY